MKQLLSVYKRIYHFAFNFYSIFLLITFIPDIIGFSPKIVTYGYWAVKALLAIIVISRHNKKLYLFEKSEKLFIFVVVIYFSNIIADRFLQRYPTDVGSHIDIIDFILSILIALSFRYEYEFSSDRAYTFFIITLSLGLFVAYFLAKESPREAMAGRFDANSTVNTINYGQMGCALCIISIYGFIKHKIKYRQIIYPLLFILGMISIVKAGSRSPVAVFVAVMSIYLLAKTGVAKSLVIAGVVVITLYFSMDFLVALSESMGSSLSTRLVSAVENGETSGRGAIYENVVGIIKKSWLFGNYYLVPSGLGKNGYPHNFFLEAFLATGIIGGIPFVIMTLLALYKSFLLLKTEHHATWIILFFFQIFFFGMFSSSLFSSQDFWALCFFILSIPKGEKLETTELHQYFVK